MANNRQPTDIKELAERWGKGKLTQEERNRFEKWYADFNDEELNLVDSRHSIAEEIRKTILDKINAEINREEVSSKNGRVLPLWSRIAVAVSVLLFISVGGYLFLKESFQQTAHNQIHDIQPGGNKAILTLSSGKQIVLTGAKNGVLANQGNAAITKTADGKIVYKAGSSSNETNTIIAFNMITTPRGGQFQVVLPDGSQVWLNAASSIKYPTVFAGKERKIDLTGEAYFEVIHNNKKPFRVVTGNQIVEDIGTHFDINAYNDEPSIRTTLLEGSISILKGVHKVILKPGKQAISQLNNDDIKVDNADTDEAIAWKNGYFLFNDESLQSVMRKISRWYDVDVVYSSGQNISDSFGGSMTRYNNVSKVLKMLEATSDVHFQIKGRKIFVTIKDK